MVGFLASCWMGIPIGLLVGAAGFIHRGPRQMLRVSCWSLLAAWGEGYLPYLFQKWPDPHYDPNAEGNFAWDVYREM